VTCHGGRSLLALPSSADRLAWTLVGIIAVLYFFGLTPGHVFAQDDFAAYVMHAANLVEGRPYTQIHYLTNPEAPWISPANGYPPAYPLLLAPVYWRWGMNLRLMKAVTVATFAIFLTIFALWVRPLVSARQRIAAVALVGLSPAFWSYRDLISSEFPYLMISFLALLAIRRAHSDRKQDDWRPKWAVVVALLMYAAYATRTIGIALPIAFVIAELQVRRRLSRFALLTISILGGCVLLQAALLTSPTGYVSAAHITLGSVARNAWFYTKSLTYTWQNGFSKPVQVVLAFFLTGFAGLAFAQRIRRGASVDVCYLLAYVAILFAWGAQIGIRGLLPILPVYLTYILLGMSDVCARLGNRTKLSFLAVTVACLLVTYAGSLRLRPWQDSMANVQDAPAQELFSFIRAQTSPTDLLVFSKPRSIALFTGRPTTSLGPDESASNSAEFLKRTRAKFLIQTAWNPPAYGRLLASAPETLTEVFRNRDFQVFRIGPANTNQTARAGIR
jgi:hypothetical protein